MNKRLFGGYKSQYTWSPYNEQSKHDFNVNVTKSAKKYHPFTPTGFATSATKISTVLGIKRSTFMTTLGCVAGIVGVVLLSLIIVSANSDNIRAAKQKAAAVAFSAPAPTVSEEVTIEEMEAIAAPAQEQVTITHALVPLATAENIASGKLVIDRFEIQKVLATSPVAAVKGAAYAITVDGQSIVYLKTKAEAESVLTEIVNRFTGGNADTQYAWQENIAIVKSQVESSALKTKDQAIDYLLTGSVKVETYEIQEGDTLWSICIEKGIDQTTVADANPGMDPETIIAGDTIQLNKVVPYVHMTTTETAIGKEEIPFEDLREETSDLANGEVEIIEAGVVGEREVTRELVKVNGEIVQNTELKSITISEPKTQVSRIGTGLPFAGGKTGTLAYPMYGFGISSVFGDGRAHTGIDMTNPVGTPIYAAESGVVTSAGWNGGYGILVIVDHGGGVTTYYAHMSETTVTVGQRVGRGETLGYVGLTGNTTGPHLHFEVRVDGVPQDPYAWL
jgi:murein DD-endopeptidase MepM/ murein hydrolase activator NlpD